MPRSLGTRSTGTTSTRIESRSMTRGLNRDLGLSTNVTAALTFSATTGQVTATAGTFAAFATNVPVLVASTVYNEGYFVVTATDASTYLTLAPAPQNEGPVTATLRTI